MYSLRGKGPPGSMKSLKPDVKFNECSSDIRKGLYTAKLQRCEKEIQKNERELRKSLG